ncbi:MAG: hypothetical protein LKF52_04735 [Butyrivibrio sp.]|jgi:tetratricopeptide (TPR) repeat protein|nr:hypothetical protein [Butyrivibrio sp.]
MSYHKKWRVIVFIPFVIISIALVFALFIRVSFSGKYEEGVQAYHDQDYEKTKSIMEKIVPYSDSQEYIRKSEYKIAEKLFNSGNYEEAIKIYEKLGNYEECEERKNEANKKIIEREQYKIYEKAKYQYYISNYFEAKKTFESLGEYGDASEWIEKCKYNIRVKLSKTIFTGSTVTYALDNLGKILTTADGGETEAPKIEDYESWKNLISISGRASYLIGLDAKGNVYLAKADIEDADVNTANWSDILQVASGDRFVAGLRSDQKVVASGRNAEGQLNVEKWSQIIQIDCGREDIVGLDKYGKIHIAGEHSELESIINSNAEWNNVCSIAVGSGYGEGNNKGGFHIVGLRKDGTVIAVGDNNYGQYTKALKWTNITKIVAGDWTTVGLNKDGRVLASGYYCEDGYDNAGKVSDWRNIIDISAGRGNTLGLASNGKCLATGFNESDKTKKATEWNNLLILKLIR